MWDKMQELLSQGAPVASNRCLSCVLLCKVSPNVIMRTKSNSDYRENRFRAVRERWLLTPGV